ncbi:fluoride efflux transporter CrcB [Roseibium litorale]|uniref:Fluoride-specific ion channel FluC n=1 Tax=Roseibium litorale TaxID=2803841 RepID=A0ABR9CH92_9HYPH|nr:fluoride efflux transporter CrcB [Roseibium litorale]MBD8890219.1 fluoride efflux transporter CrcB [Roseibium litorale]
MKHLLLVMLGGGLGAGGRHLVGLLALRHLGSGFPYGTLTVNVVGSLIMGLFIGFLARHDVPYSQDIRLLAATGFLGGFTTFSSFSLDTAFLWERGQWELALGYVALSVIVSLAAVFAGLQIMRHMAA